MSLFLRFAGALIARASRRPPDFCVGGRENPYLRRWWMIPRNPLFNVYLHQFLRDDDDRALHDHPWAWWSLVLDGAYVEHTIAAGGIHYVHLRGVGSVKWSGPRRAHRVSLLPQDARVETRGSELWLVSEMNARRPCWTLFLTGPRVREWGFHCPHAGWVHWRDFVASNDRGSVGRGCDQ